PLNALRFLVEYRDEFLADDFPLRLRISDASEFSEKTLGGVNCDQPQPEVIAQALLNLFELILAQHAVVDEHTSKPGRAFVAPHGAIHQSGRNPGVDAAGESADGASLAHGLADAGDG